MDRTKIRLSPEEMALVTRGDWILTKNDIIEKTKQLFATLQPEQKYLLESYSSSLPAEIVNSSPKISKGENYKGLPYLVLDYPRFFNKEDVFVIRIFFWWGNFFSGTVHLAGKYKVKYEKKVFDSFISLREKEFAVCINEDQWEHHFERDNYLSLHTFSPQHFEEIISKRNFIKLSKKIPLQQWNEAEKKLLKIFNQLVDTLTN